MPATTSPSCAPRAWRAPARVSDASLGLMHSFRNKRRVRHSAQDMFDLVADVERYPEFVPLCRDLRIRKREAKGEGTEVLVADMTVSYKLVRETFRSRVTLDRPE